MSLTRAFLLQHRTLVVLVFMAALCMKVLVPSGVMIGPGSKILTVQICADAFGGDTARQLVVPMKDGSGEAGSNQGKGECPYTALSMASLAGAGPALLALALVFILLLGLAPVRYALPGRMFHLRPPLRGPPALP